MSYCSQVKIKTSLRSVFRHTALSSSAGVSPLSSSALHDEKHPREFCLTFYLRTVSYPLIIEIFQTECQSLSHYTKIYYKIKVQNSLDGISFGNPAFFGFNLPLILIRD